MSRRPDHWQPDQDLAIGRLAWLAAFPELHRRSLPWWRVPLRSDTAPVEMPAWMRSILHGQPESAYSPFPVEPDDAAEAKTDRMARYAEPVDKVAERLSVDEQAALRDTGTLPDWFFDAVEKERKAERRSQR